MWPIWMLPSPSDSDPILGTALPSKHAQPQPPPNNPPNLPSSLSYADCVRRISKSVGGTALQPLPFPHGADDITRDVHRTFLPHAILFNLNTHSSSSYAETVLALAEAYGNKVLAIRRVPRNRAVELGFREDQDLEELIRTGFTLKGEAIPMERTFSLNQDVVKITVTDLAVQGKEKTAEALREYFSTHAHVVDIRLHYQCPTEWLLPSATVFLDVKQHPELLSNLPRRPVILGSPATLLWSNAPQLCNYCKRTGHSLSQCRQRLKGSAKSTIDPFATPSPTGRKRRRPRSRSRTPPIDTSPADKEPPSERKERAPGQVELLSAPSPSTTLTQCHDTTSPKERPTPKSVEDHPLTAPRATASSATAQEKAGKTLPKFNFAALFPPPKTALKVADKAEASESSERHGKIT
jgi:hypothetical protein